MQPSFKLFGFIFTAIAEKDAFEVLFVWMYFFLSICFPFRNHALFNIYLLWLFKKFNEVLTFPQWSNSLIHMLDAQFVVAVY